MKYHLAEISSIRLKKLQGSIVFLEGDLGSGKTTFVQNILKNQLGISTNITSPTYTYYNKYGDNIYHFDLYRLESYDEFFAIGGEEILDSGATCFIEWPDVLKKQYHPDIQIDFLKTDDEMSRDVTITYK